MHSITDMHLSRILQNSPVYKTKNNINNNNINLKDKQIADLV